LRFHIVDVFAESKFAGNQLAVAVPRGAVSAEGMQQIAQEMHFSETTFVWPKKKSDGGYEVRVFTPDQELPFAGHPTLGTAYIVQSLIIRKPVSEVKLDMKVGQIPVAFTYRRGVADILWMKQKEPAFGRIFDPSEVAPLLGVDASDFDQRFPIMEVSTGLWFAIAPLKSLKAVRRVILDRAATDRYLKSAKAIGFLVFSPETYSKENDLNVRVLGPSPSIPEDPATGSGNGSLAAYLVKHRYFDKDTIDVKVEQGYEIGRRSLLLLRASRKGASIEVRVGGRVQYVAKGDLAD